MPDAKLYTVQSSRGTVYALQDVSSGMFWTERTEEAARQLALEKRLVITSEEEIPHSEFLRMMGHEPVRHPPQKHAAPSPAPAREPDFLTPPPASPRGNVIIQNNPADTFEFSASAEEVSSPPPLLEIPLRYHWEDEAAELPDDALVIPREEVKKVSNVFCSEGQVTDSLQPPAPGQPAQPPARKSISGGRFSG